MTHFAEIILPLALQKNYTWLVPEDLIQQTKPGKRAEVVFGKNKKYAGLIKRVHQEKPEGFVPKPILQILDETPIVEIWQLQLWEWIASYYMCSEGDVMQAALPAHFKLSSESILLWNEDHQYDLPSLSDQEFLIAEALEIKKELSIVEVQQILDAKQVYPVVKKLTDKKICFIWESLQETYRQKKELYVELHPFYRNEKNLEQLLNEWSKAPKQLQLLLAFLHLQKTEGEIIQKDLLKKADATAAQLKGLVDKEVLQIFKRGVDRITAQPKKMELTYDLSTAQLKAFKEIKTTFLDKQVCLLHGVTSSGKTEVYMKLMQELLVQNKQVLYLLPEIALTAQLIQRLQSCFGGHVGVYHSKFSSNERIEIWNKVQSGEIGILVGARSALFLPFAALGLIIVDEEHDTSFKQQDPAPRYHARDVAVYLSSSLNCKVLLGTATPSLESYYNASEGKYGLVHLLERFGQVHLPEIELMDLKTWRPPKDAVQTIFSPPMVQAIAQTLSENKQVIIFQNRRGYSPYWMCSSCGWIPTCQHCAVSLTHHKAKNKLSCHYCGSQYPLVHTCSACGNHEFLYKNIGTEQIEETLLQIFPTARIARMDYDSIKGKHSHEQLIRQFELHKIDILVGTQMVVKGLDFEKVQMVGIVDGDSLLNFADFRVNERAFQLIEQVSGRAGRRSGQGKVMIQLRQINHPVIRYALSHNYNDLYINEVLLRKEFGYPPYSRIIQIAAKHVKEEVALQLIRELYKSIPNYSKYIQGPSQPVISRIKNQFIYEIWLKLPRNMQVLQKCKHDIQQAIQFILQKKEFRGGYFQCNVDPF